MHSIRLRFMVLLSLLLALLLLLLNTVPAILARDAIFQEKQNAMGSQAAVLASALASLENLSAAGVDEALAFLDLSEIDRVAVFDRGGRTLHDSSEDGAEPADLSAALAGRTLFRSRFEGAAFLSSIAMPVSDGGELIGAVYLQERDEEHAGTIRSVQQNLLALSIFIAAVALLSGALFVQRFSGRLRSLIASMRKVAQGDFSSQPTIRGQDEISALGAEFNELTARLKSTEAERRRFVADASHELKTPLASIRLLSDSIMQNKGMDAATMREFVSDIGGEAVRLQRTTEKLLTLSRLDSGREQPPEPIALAETALDVLESLRPLARQKAVALRTSLEPDCLALGTQDGMDHILYNLIENAIKYNIPGGEVLVTLRALGGEVELAVADTGIGIPAADIPYIFERFYRVDKARSREAGGSGLGLSIVHDAVLAAKGSISVKQNNPQGTRFIVRFPRYRTKETETTT